MASEREPLVRPGDVIPRDHAIGVARNVARKHGYAIGVHGSLARDVDLIAAPWTDDASTARALVEAIAEALPGVINVRDHEKPHGRRGWTIYPRFMWGQDRWYLDISVMPRRRQRRAA